MACRYKPANRASVRIGDGEQLGVHAAFRATDQLSKSPFFPQARSCAVRLQIGRIDRHGAALGPEGQTSPPSFVQTHRPHSIARLRNSGWNLPDHSGLAILIGADARAAFASLTSIRRPSLRPEMTQRVSMIARRINSEDLK